MKPGIAVRIWRFFAIVAPWAAAAICFVYVDHSIWADATGSLVPALALITGAILLRLMRPFPITDPDGFADLDEIDSLEDALQQVMRALAVAVSIAVLAILLLVFRAAFVNLGTGVSELDSYRGELYSAALGWMTTYLALRIVYVVRLDFSMVRRQAKAVRQALKRREARDLAEARRLRDDNNYNFRDTATYPGRSAAGH